jgi:hypothetical protein
MQLLWAAGLVLFSTHCLHPKLWAEQQEHFLVGGDVASCDDLADAQAKADRSTKSPVRCLELAISIIQKLRTSNLPTVIDQPEVGAQPV